MLTLTHALCWSSKPSYVIWGIWRDIENVCSPLCNPVTVSPSKMGESFAIIILVKKQRREVHSSVLNQALNNMVPKKKNSGS